MKHPIKGLHGMQPKMTKDETENAKEMESNGMYQLRVS